MLTSDEGPHPSDDGDGLLAAADRGSPATCTSARSRTRHGGRRVPRAVRRRRQRGARRPGARRARHPHERRLPPRQRPRRPVVVLVSDRSASTGMSEFDTETDARLEYPVGTWLNEIVGGWKYHAVDGQDRARGRRSSSRRSGASRRRRSEKPVKFGTIAADLASDRADGQDRCLRRGQARADVGHRDDPQRRAARARRGRLQGDPDRGAGDPQLCRVRRAGRGRSTSSSTSSTTRRGPRRRRALGAHLLGQSGRAALLRPEHLLRAVGRHLPQPPQGDVWTIESKDNDHTLLSSSSPRTRATCRRRSRSA